MVVIVIIGMVLAFSMPMFNSGQAKYNNTVNNIIDRMNVARQGAITQNQVALFYINADSFTLGSQCYNFDKNIEVEGVKVLDGIGTVVSYENPIQFNPGGTSDFAILTITGYNRTTNIIIAPSGYILKSEE